MNDQQNGISPWDDDTSRFGIRTFSRMINKSVFAKNNNKKGKQLFGNEMSVSFDTIKKNHTHQDNHFVSQTHEQRLDKLRHKKEMIIQKLNHKINNDLRRNASNHNCTNHTNPKEPSLTKYNQFKQKPSEKRIKTEYQNQQIHIEEPVTSRGKYNEDKILEGITKGYRNFHPSPPRTNANSIKRIQKLELEEEQFYKRKKSFLDYIKPILQTDKSKDIANQTKTSAFKCYQPKRSILKTLSRNKSKYQKQLILPKIQIIDAK